MRRAGLVVAEALAAVRERAAPGVTTGAARRGRGRGHRRPPRDGRRSWATTGYPATLCVSVNDEVVHGIPGAAGAASRATSSRSTAARSSTGGTVTPRSRSSSTAPRPRTSTWRPPPSGPCGPASPRWPAAERLGVVGEAVEDVVDAAEAAGLNGGARYGLVEEYVGHGIGTSMHQPPDVPNFRSRDRGPRVRPGLCVAVEPMVVRGQRFTQVLDDDWTVVTSDGSRASHWEHTVADPGGRHLGADGRRRWRAGARRARRDRRSARLSGLGYPPSRSNQVNLRPVIHKSPVIGRIRAR